jgi:hypothetical protein
MNHAHFYQDDFIKQCQVYCPNGRLIENVYGLEFSDGTTTITFNADTALPHWTFSYKNSRGTGSSFFKALSRCRKLYTGSDFPRGNEKPLSWNQLSAVILLFPLGACILPYLLWGAYLLILNFWYIPVGALVAVQALVWITNKPTQ